MTFQYKISASGRWNKFSLVEQMANIGSEAFRAIKWKARGDHETSRNAFDRALELFDLTIADSKNKNRLGEICRARELFCDFFIGENQYQQTTEQWEKYFYAFNYAARNKRT